MVKRATSLFLSPVLPKLNSRTKVSFSKLILKELGQQFVNWKDCRLILNFLRKTNILRFQKQSTQLGIHSKMNLVRDRCLQWYCPVHILPNQDLSRTNHSARFPYVELIWDIVYFLRRSVSLKGKKCLNISSHLKFLKQFANMSNKL